MGLIRYRWRYGDEGMRKGKDYEKGDRLNRKKNCNRSEIYMDDGVIIGEVINSIKDLNVGSRDGDKGIWEEIRYGKGIWGEMGENKEDIIR